VVPHDDDQLEQVLINLVKNAVEASSAGARVRVRITAAQPEVRGTRIVVPGAVCVQIQDQGPGIEAEPMRHVFEPFFTTKPGGTGLGLYISHDIVKRHSGALTVQSEPGRGATFAVRLPLEPEGGLP
jgi:signal transduction histidine kinase